jgi:hypothetical protein
MKGNLIPSKGEKESFYDSGGEHILSCFNEITEKKFL